MKLSGWRWKNTVKILKIKDKHTHYKDLTIVPVIPKVKSNFW